jgi:hypothetical protein
MQSSPDKNALDAPEAFEKIDTTVQDADEDLETVNSAPDFYQDQSGDLDDDQRSNEAEDSPNVSISEPLASPRTPRPLENSSSQPSSSAPSTPSLAPISWQDAAESKVSPAKDPHMPSFTDSAMLDQLEINSKQSAANLVVLVHHLRTQLANISSLSVQYMTLHKTAVEGVSEHVHDGIASAQKLILKAQSLNTELKKVYTVQQDIKDTKKLLGQLEKLVEKLTKS